MKDMSHEIFPNPKKTTATSLKGKNDGRIPMHFYFWIPPIWEIYGNLSVKTTCASLAQLIIDAPNKNIIDYQYSNDVYYI